MKQPRRYWAAFLFSTFVMFACAQAFTITGEARGPGSAIPDKADQLPNLIVENVIVPGQAAAREVDVFVDAGARDLRVFADSVARDAGNPAPDYVDRDGSRNDLGADGLRATWRSYQVGKTGFTTFRGSAPRFEGTSPC